jgi:hypothetical protein
MKNILICIALCVTPFLVWGQDSEPIPLKDRLVPRFGFTLSFLQTVDTFSSFTGSYDYDFNAVALGTYVMLAHHNDWASVGADVGLNVGLDFANINNRLNWMVQTPLMLVGRIGAASTAYSSQKLGFGLGLGGTLSYLNYQNGYIEQKNLWFHPTAMAEVNIRSRQNLVTVRLGTSLGTVGGQGNTIAPFGGPGYSVETGGPLRGRLITASIMYGF